MLQLAAPWLLLLLPLPWLARRLLPAYRPSRPAAFVPFMERLKHVTGAGTGLVVTVAFLAASLAAFTLGDGPATPPDLIRERIG